MATTNHERVGKSLDLLKAGLGPFVERGQDRPEVAKARRLQAPRLCRGSRAGEQAHVRVGRGRAAQADVGDLERRLPHNSRACGTQPRQRAAQPPQQVGPPGDLLQRRRLSGAGLGGPAPRRGLGAAVRRARTAQDGAAARALRRAGARGAAPAGGRRHRERRRGQPQAVAGDRHPPQGRSERTLPAGRVRGRPLAGAPGRRDGRVPRPGRVLSANLPDGEPEGPAGRGDPPPRRSPRRPGRRPRHPATDQLRGRQDPLHARPVPPVLGDSRRGSCPASTPCSRKRRRRCSGRHAGWCWSATRSRRGTR